MNSNLCEESQIGEFIVSKTANLSSYGKIVTQKIDLTNPTALNYPLEKTGFYCVSTFPSSSSINYNAVAVFQNSYGNLAASQIPKLPFFGGAAIAYALVFALWMFQYVQHRSDILPVQNYITAICGFLVVEMITIWGYYDYTNSSNSTVGSTIYLITLSILNAFRNAFTFFLLLIVCLGYGVVKPSLGDLMWKCRALAAAHFIFAVVYTISSYIVSPDHAGPVVLFVVLPLSLTMTTFYVWILASLASTTKHLEERKQQVKAQMYRKLWHILLGSIIIIFGFFFINAVVFASESTLDFITNHWKSRWFMLDGWLNVVYFVDFCIIAFLWRPTENNRRFAMSTQLAQDENEVQEFDLGSLRESLDEEQQVGESPRNDENNHESDDEIETLPDYAPPSYSKGTEVKGTEVKGTKMADTSYQAGAESSTTTGETVFAVGEDEDEDDIHDDYNEWQQNSDDDNDDDEESQRLKGKNK